MTEVTLSEASFRALWDRLRRTSGWGPADRLGALNNISPAGLVAAARGVRDGRTVSLAAPIASEVTPDNPDPAVHQMTHWADDTAASGLTATCAANPYYSARAELQPNRARISRRKF